MAGKIVVWIPGETWIEKVELHIDIISYSAEVNRKADITVVLSGVSDQTMSLEMPVAGMRTTSSKLCSLSANVESWCER